MYIELTKGYITLVDDDLLQALNDHLWHVLDSHPTIRYAARWIKGTRPRRVMRMHHQVLDIGPEWLNEQDLVVDHIDRDGLNNTVENLRIVSRSDNAKNSDRSDNAAWIWWDRYRDRYRIVQPGGSFIAWRRTLIEAIEVRNAYH